MRIDNGIFDDGPLSIITSSSVATIASRSRRRPDVRRFRPNLVIETPESRAFPKMPGLAGRFESEKERTRRLLDLHARHPLRNVEYPSRHRRPRRARLQSRSAPQRELHRRLRDDHQDGNGSRRRRAALRLGISHEQKILTRFPKYLLQWHLGCRFAAQPCPRSGSSSTTAAVLATRRRSALRRRAADVLQQRHADPRGVAGRLLPDPLLHRSPRRDRRPAGRGDPRSGREGLGGHPRHEHRLPVARRRRRRLGRQRRTQHDLASPTTSSPARSSSPSPPTGTTTTAASSKPTCRSIRLAISGGYNMQQLVDHEMGHVLGLDHSAVLSSVMYPYIGNGTSVALDSDDRVAIGAAYPKNETGRGRHARRTRVRRRRRDLRRAGRGRERQR